MRLHFIRRARVWRGEMNPEMGRSLGAGSAVTRCEGLRPNPGFAIGYRSGGHGSTGSVLVGVLWCVVLLSMVVISVLHTSRLDLVAGRCQTDRIQAHYLALAGVEKAKALLHESVINRSRAGIPHSAELLDAPAQFREVTLGRGKFSVVRAPRSDESPGRVYGVGDEESRLNVNVADLTELTNIVGLTSDVAAAIIDWRDGDNTVTPGGAEAPYYASLQPPYLPRNAPFPTLRELLMVRGINRELLFGETALPDSGQVPVLDSISNRPSPKTGVQDEPLEENGWASLLTVHSGVENVDATGAARVNIQNADEVALTGVRGITTEIAKAIIAYRQQNRLQNLTDLLDVTAGPPVGSRPGQNFGGGRKVIDERLFKEIADRLTTDDRTDIDGAVNVNSAGAEVLRCLPGMDRNLAQAVVAHRQANGWYNSVAGLLDVPGLNRTLLQQVAPRLVVRSDTFRIRVEGEVDGSRQQIETIVRVRARSVVTLAYREDDL